MISNHGKYTVVLGELLKDPLVKEKIDKALSTYPLYQSKSEHKYIPNIIPSREDINQKLLNHYKYREIGFETVGRFIDELEIAMKEIMPFYNQLMFTQDQDFNIIYNVDYKRITETLREGQNSGNVDTSGSSETDSETRDTNRLSATVNHDSKNVQSQTPQSELSITAENIDNVSYADEVRWSKDKNNDTSESSGTTSGNSSNTISQNTESSGSHTESENIEESIIGNYGQVSAQRLVLTYRETILNIEQQIIKDRRIQELFMMIL